jgi:hypothetical protein
MSSFGFFSWVAKNDDEPFSSSSSFGFISWVIEDDDEPRG